MPITLEIHGQDVEVDDSFASLSPEEQSRTVDEIAGSMVAPVPEIQKPRMMTPREISPTEGFFRGMAETLTGNYLDELSGLFTRAMGGSPSEAQMVTERSRMASEDAPQGARVAGNIAGAAPFAAIPAAGGPLVAKMGAGAMVGGTLGAISESGRAEGGMPERVQAGQRGLQSGAIFGAGAPVLSAGVGKLATTFNKTFAPTLERLREVGGKLYDQASDIGLTVRGDSLRRMADRMYAAIRAEGYSPRIHKRIKGALEEILDAADAGDQPLSELRILRRIAQSAGKSMEPDERRLGRMLVEEFDDLLVNLSPGEVVSGNPQAVSAVLKQANKVWSRVKKAETIEDLFERARLSAPNFSGSGFENAVRTEFRNLAKNAKRMRQFNKLEQEAIKRVAKGGPVENVLRFFGKFAPTGVVSTVLSGGAGGVVGGPVGAVALPAAGAAARGGATSATLRNAQAVSELVRGGAPPVGTEAERLARALLLSQTPNVLRGQ